MLNDLLLTHDPCERGLGGIIQMQFIPRAAVEAMGIPSGLTFAGPLTLKPFQPWFTVGMMDKTNIYHEELSDILNGHCTILRWAEYIPRDDPATPELPKKMSLYYYLVCAMDYEGSRQSVGNLHKILKLKISILRACHNLIYSQFRPETQKFIK